MKTYNWKGRKCYLRKDMENALIENEKHFLAEDFPRHWSATLSRVFSQYEKVRTSVDPLSIRETLSPAEFCDFCEENGLPRVNKQTQVIYSLRPFLDPGVAVSRRYSHIFKKTFDSVRTTKTLKKKKKVSLTVSGSNISGSVAWVEMLKGEAEKVLQMHREIEAEDAKLKAARKELQAREDALKARKINVAQAMAKLRNL